MKIIGRTEQNGTEYVDCRNSMSLVNFVKNMAAAET